MDLDLTVQISILQRGKTPSPKNKLKPHYLQCVVPRAKYFTMNPDVAYSFVKNNVEDPPSGLYYAQPKGIDGKYLKARRLGKFIF